MNRLLRAWQLAILLNGLPHLQSFISHSARTRHSNIAPDLKSLVRSFSSRFGYEKSEELSRLEEIEFYLYTDSIDRKLMQSEFSDPFSSSSRGIISSRGSIKDSSHLNRDSLQLMLRKETENAVRAVSMFGGLLSVIISRDIWYAASSFLIMNIFATQSNGIGTITRITGARIDLLMREIMKIVRLLTEFCFKGEIERNSFREVSGYSFSNPRNTRALGKKVKPDFEPILDDDYEYEDENVIDAEREVEKKKLYDRLDSVISAVTVDPIVENKKQIKAKESVVQPAIPPSSSVKVLNTLTPPLNRASASASTSGGSAMSSYNSSTSSSSNNGAISTTNPSRIPLGTLISSAAKSAVTHKPPIKPAATVLPSPSAVYAATTPLSSKTTSSGVGVISESVVNATIEVQAAADAAAERLKSWLSQQRKVEELKRREKIVNLLEQNRGKDSSLKRKGLLLDLALFITSNDANADGSDKNNSSNNIDYNTADKKTNNNNNNNSSKNKNSATTATSTSTSTSTSKSSNENVNDISDESEGKTFSKLSIEFEVGSIHDFVAVLVSPGKINLFICFHGDNT
jgi:hypothetical protein